MATGISRAVLRDKRGRKTSFKQFYDRTKKRNAVNFGQEETYSMSGDYIISGGTSISKTGSIRGSGDRRYKQTEKKCDIRYGFASVSLWIDYDEFLQSDLINKQIMIVKNILDSIKVIARKAKIDYEKFYDDIIQYCEQINLQF